MFVAELVLGGGGGGRRGSTRAGGGGVDGGSTPPYNLDIYVTYRKSKNIEKAREKSLRNYFRIFVSLRSISRSPEVSKGPMF